MLYNLLPIGLATWYRDRNSLLTGSFGLFVLCRFGLDIPLSYPLHTIIIMTDSHDSPDFIQSLIKLFYMVGGVLVAGTLITVLIDVLIPMPLYFAAIIGLSIAW